MAKMAARLHGFLAFQAFMSLLLVLSQPFPSQAASGPQDKLETVISLLAELQQEYKHCSPRVTQNRDLRKAFEHLIIQNISSPFFGKQLKIGVVVGTWGKVLQACIVCIHACQCFREDASIY